MRQAHPQREIESCASGGGRMDAGVLAHTHRFWTSDSTDALSWVGTQRGALQFFPPERLGAHIGPEERHQLAAWIALYKRLRGHMHHGTM